ncbi:MAG TPA: glycine cleavage system aminomethyltransferase GcvT [Gemmatimonadota bacterium]|jgi:aminomethyltransferase
MTSRETTESAAATGELRETPLAAVHRAAGAKLVPFAGFRMPVHYGSILAEHRAVRERAGLFDVSHMGRFLVTGPGAAAFLDRMTVNDVRGLDDGKAQYSCLCRPDGGILDDIVLGRLGDAYHVVVNASNRGRDLDWLRQHLPADVVLRDRSDETALVALQGPRAESVLAPLASVDLSRLAFYSLAEGAVAGLPAVISRTGYTGEDGFELTVAAEHGVRLWEALAAAGQVHGVAAAGLGARDTLRLEMKYPLYGNEIDEGTNPIEAGLGWIVKLDGADFVGREALRRVKDAGPRRRLVGFTTAGKAVPRAGYEVFVGGEPAGPVRSGTMSPSLGVGIGTSYVPAAAARPGTRLEIGVRGRREAAEVVRTPFYRGGSIRR